MRFMLILNSLIKTRKPALLPTLMLGFKGGVASSLPRVGSNASPAVGVSHGVKRRVGCEFTYLWQQPCRTVLRASLISVPHFLGRVTHQRFGTSVIPIGQKKDLKVSTHKNCHSRLYSLMALSLILNF